MRRCYAALSTLIILVAAVQAQSPPPIELWLTPAKLPTPGLRYQLLPDARLTITGDAAPLYKQAGKVLEKKPLGDNSKYLEQWLVLPLDQLPRDDAQKLLAEYKEVLELVDKAVCCDHCDWGVLER